MIDTPTNAQSAAADLAARVMFQSIAGPLQGVRVKAEAVGGRVMLTVLELPAGAVERTPAGLAPTLEGSAITRLLHILAVRACQAADVRKPTLIQIAPHALAAALCSTPVRRAS